MAPTVEVSARKHHGLVVIAILLGMATAAVIVLLLALRSPASSANAASAAPGQAGRPSPFGSPIARPITPPDVKLSPADIAKSGIRSVVTVVGYDGADKPLAQAKGYVYSSSGIIVTSFSAIRGASSVEVETSNGEELNVIALMGYSPSRDLAVLAVLEGNLSSLETTDDDAMPEGSAVFALGTGGAISQGTVGPRRAVGGVDLIAIGAPAAAGSPVVNDHGKVIGVAVKRGGSFVVPSHYISDLISERRSISFAQMLEETRAPTP